MVQKYFCNVKLTDTCAGQTEVSVILHLFCFLQSLRKNDNLCSVRFHDMKRESCFFFLTEMTISDYRLSMMTHQISETFWCSDEEKIFCLHTHTHTHTGNVFVGDSWMSSCTSFRCPASFKPLGGVSSMLLISQKPEGKMEGEVEW